MCQGTIDVTLDEIWGFGGGLFSSVLWGSASRYVVGRVRKVARSAGTPPDNKFGKDVAVCIPPSLIADIMAITDPIVRADRSTPEDDICILTSYQLIIVLWMSRTLEKAV